LWSTTSLSRSWSKAEKHHLLGNHHQPFHRANILWKVALIAGARELPISANTVVQRGRAVGRKNRGRLMVAVRSICGSGTHPGGGVTGAPEHNAAKAIVTDLKRRSLRRS